MCGCAASRTVIRSKPRSPGSTRSCARRALRSCPCGWPRAACWPTAVVSDVDVPGFDRATMDGYAVVAESTEGATSYNRLPLVVIGDSLPGHPFQGSVALGQGVRIMTGAPLPLGCDAVLPAEWIEDADCDERHRQRPRRRIARQKCRQTRRGHRPRNHAVPARPRAASAGSGRAQLGRRRVRCACSAGRGSGWW